MINREPLLEELVGAQNPWWTHPGARPNLPRRIAPRRGLEEILATLDGKEITTLLGPRQVGKTTILGEAVSHLLDAGTDPGRILYVNFDSLAAAVPDERAITALMEIFRRMVLRRSWTDVVRGEEKIFVFLDEVQAAADWSRTLKGWYDLGLPVKFVVSGSSSADILKGASESLAGRIAPHLILPLSFREFAGYHGPRAFDEWSARAATLASALGRGVTADAWIKTFEKSVKTLPGGGADFEALFGEYIVQGGYPGVLSAVHRQAALSTLRAIGDITIYKDLVRFYQIRNPKGLDRLVAILAHESASIVSRDSISRDLGINVRTVADYLDYLESAWMFRRSPMYTGSPRVSSKHLTKIHAVDPGLANAYKELGPGGTPSEKATQSLVESTVFSHMLRMQVGTGRILGEGPWYWRDGPKGLEVDVVGRMGGRAVPVEVKHARNLDERDFKGLRAFLEAHKDAGPTVMASRETFDVRGRVAVMPAWFFTLMA